MNPSDKVVHNYKDRALEADPQSAGEGGRAIPLGMDHNFPTKLHYMLSTIEDDGQANVISWQPHGRCFMVHDMNEFVSSMLPLWFRQSKFASFQRQLNLYGFHRLTQGRDKNAYYHEYFLRGRPLLAQKISRTKVKGKGARKASSPETEPKLYDFPWMKETKKPTTAKKVVIVTPNNPNQNISPTLAVLAQLAPAPQPLVAAPAPVPTASVLAEAMALAKPRKDLGDALGFLGRSLTMPAQATAPVPGGETMFLPVPAVTSANQAALSSLLSSFTPTPPPVDTISLYVPIAPAPPAYEGEPYKPSLSTSNNYSSVLTALKVSHANAMAQMEGRLFTTPGPTTGVRPFL